MKTTGIFKLHQFDIPLRGKGKPVFIQPFGCVHYGAPLHAKKEFQQFMAWGRNRDDCYFLGMGDYQDLASTTERKVLSDTALHESTKSTLDSVARAQTDAFIKILEPMKGRIIGLLEGNHYAVLSDGSTTTQYMCKELGCQYLGVMAIVRLALEAPFNLRKPIHICAYHGKGAARLLGSSLNTVQHMAEGIDADIFLMGHDHKRGAVPGDRVHIDYNSKTQSVKLEHRTLFFCRTGGFLKAFEDGKCSYVADRGNGALPIGGIRIEVSLSRPVVSGDNDNCQQAQHSIKVTV